MKLLQRESTGFFSRSEVWLVHSDIVGDTFRVCVTAPELPSGAAYPDSAKYGAVIGLDAGLMSGALASTCLGCALGGELPPLYAISVGYPTDANPPPLLQRNRDLTPSVRQDLVAMLPKLWGLDIEVSTGGADNFLSFLRNELLPELQQAFPIDRSNLTLAGSSLGGLFTLHAFLTDPNSFTRYLAISPSIWWDHHLALRRAEALVRERKSVEGRLYMCAGELESLTHMKAQFASYPPELLAAVHPEMLAVDMLGDMLAMRDVLTTWASDQFSVEAHIYPEESHVSIAGAAMSRGLRKLFGTLQ